MTPENNFYLTNGEVRLLRAVLDFTAVQMKLRKPGTNVTLLEAMDAKLSTLEEVIKLTT